VSYNPNCTIGNQAPLQALIFTLPIDIDAFLIKLNKLILTEIKSYQLNKQYPQLNELALQFKEQGRQLNELALLQFKELSKVVINWITPSFPYPSAPIPTSYLPPCSSLPNFLPTLPNFLPTLSYLPPSFKLSLNEHFYLMPSLFNPHSVGFKIIIGILIIAIVALIIKVISLIFKIMKGFYIKVYTGEPTDKWNDYKSNHPLPDTDKFKYSVWEGRSTKAKFLSINNRRRREDRDGDGNGRNNKRNYDKETLYLINELEKILNEARVYYIHHGYIETEGYSIFGGGEYNPSAMQEYREAGYFERYGIHDRARYPNIEDCPYEVTHINDWRELYIRTLDLIWRIDPEYIARPLPEQQPFDGSLLNEPLYISFIQAAGELGLPPIHINLMRDW